MAQNDNIEQTNPEQEQDLNDQEIAELANAEIKKRDREIAQLRKDLAKAKLFTNAEDDGEEEMTREQCVKLIGANDTTDYDYIVATLRLRDIELAEGHPDPLGEDGDVVSEFFKGLVEECEGDKTAFNGLYQARLGKDRPEDFAAFVRAKNK